MKIKHLILFGVITAVLSLTRGFGQTVPVELTKFTCDGFSIRYFPSWRFKQEKGVQFLVDVVYSPAATSSLSISFANYRGNQEQMKVLLEMKNEKVVELITAAARERITSYRVLEHGTTKLGGFPAYWVIASYTMSGFGIDHSLQSMLLVSLRNGKLFRVFVEASDEGFQASSDEIRQMLSTFVYK